MKNISFFVFFQTDFDKHLVQFVVLVQPDSCQALLRGVGVCFTVVFGGLLREKSVFSNVCVDLEKLPWGEEGFSFNFCV